MKKRGKAGKKIRRGKAEKKKIRKIHHFTYLFAIFNLIVIFLLSDNPPIAAGLLLSIGILGLLVWNSKRTLLIFLFGGIFGAVVEISIIKSGIWTYSTKSFIDVPLWFPILWGNASAFIYQKAIEFKERRLN